MRILFLLRLVITKMKFHADREPFYGHPLLLSAWMLLSKYCVSLMDYV